LARGSSTGFTPPPRGAPRRDSRRRTAAPPMAPGGAVAGGVAGTTRAVGPGEASRTAVGAGSAEAGSTAAGSTAAGSTGAGCAEAGSVEAGPAGAGSTAAGSAGTASAAAGSAETGAAVSRAASPLSPGAAGKSCCSGAEEAASAPALPVIATSPATCTPVIRQEPILSAASRPHVLVSRCGHRRDGHQRPRMPQRFCGKRARRAEIPRPSGGKGVKRRAVTAGSARPADRGRRGTRVPG
jgi:hypothetical protein